MSQDAIERAAQQIRDAIESGEPCDFIRDTLGTDSDVELAYAVQKLNTDRDIADGRIVSGRKIGLTSEVVQDVFGVHQPDFGTLFADTCFASGVAIPANRLFQPRAEGEVALVLEHDLDKGEHCVVDIINATAYALPSIEIVDTRLKAWDLTIVDTVADNASSGVYVVGTKPVSLSSIDLLELPMRMDVNGAGASKGVGAACLGNPLHAAVWLANVMSASGTPLRAGECVMTGALGPMVGVSAGDEIVAEFGQLGTVSTRIEASTQETQS